MFILFAGETYYPRGGWLDYQGEYITLDEAIKVGNTYLCYGYNWAHIVNKLTKLIIEL